MSIFDRANLWEATRAKPIYKFSNPKNPNSAIEILLASPSLHSVFIEHVLWRFFVLCVLLEDAWRFLLCFVFFLLEFWVHFPDLVQEFCRRQLTAQEGIHLIHHNILDRLTSQDQGLEIFYSLILPRTPKNLFSSLVTEGQNSFYWIFFYILACADFLSHMSRCYKPSQPISESYHHHDSDPSNWCNFLPTFQFHFLQCFWVILQHWITCFLQCRSWNLL